MRTTKGLTLTNYINKSNGRLYHGSELSYFDRFKSGLYQKVRSYQCHQNMPYWNKKIINGKMEIVRDYYGRQEIVDYIEKI